MTVPPPPLFKFFRHIDAHKEAYIESLREAVAIPSVSSDQQRRGDVVRMLKWTEEQLKALGAVTEMCPLPINSKAKHPPSPPVLLASIASSVSKRRLLVYCHVDVAAVECPDNWSGDPFLLAELQDGTLRGRGALDCKGPLLCWLSALHAQRQLGLDMFCQLKFVVDGGLEVDSPGLEEVLRHKRNTFLKDVDLVCVSYGTWLGESTPCIIYGLRGLCYFQVEVAGCTNDLHSGEFGGLVQEPMVDLMYLMNSLQDAQGLPTIPSLNEDVRVITPEEERMYENIDFNCEDLRAQASVRKLRFDEDRSAVLMHCWRYPSLSYHGIDGASDGTEMYTTIPRRVVGKFSIRIVPNQNPEKVAEHVKRHLSHLWTGRKSSNYLCVQTTASMRPWLEDPRSPHYEAVRRAVRRVYKLEPDLVRDGASMSIVLAIQRVLDRSLVLLPMGGGVHDDDTEERCYTKHFVEGIKVVGAYMYELAQLKSLN